ncbi:fibronectin type III domain-containing protein [Halosolutus amylolyticus]|uniref:Fibronectin type III domain-containing protein n=1 Tax=Halosolutus amylolyticus TaxID=2932267 RepID=A0ABD5PTP9_9EURY|nr:fibronectin type III domain-containing protein [Halosolutus amylolyticus]
MTSNVDLTASSPRTFVVLVTVLLAAAAAAGPATAAAAGSAPIAADGDGPDVETAWADRLNETAVVAAANLTDLGDSETATVWLEYRENGTDEPWTTTAPKEAQSPDRFTWDLTGLEQGTTYEFRAVAETDAGTDYGDRQQFVTPYEPPAVTTGDAVDVTETAATLTANVTDLADRPAMDVWFAYSPADADESRWNWAETETQTIESPGVVTEAVTDLEPGTEYEFVVRVRNAEGYEQHYAGDVAQFATASAFAVETGTATDVTATTATLSGEIADFGGNADVTAWLEYAPAGADAWQETAPIAPDSSGVIETGIDGLQPGTEYVFRAAGETADGETDAGDRRTFETPVDPTIETGAVTAVDETSATVAADLTTFGGADAATVSVEYRPAGGVEWAETDAVTATATGTIETTLAGLDADTAYEYRAVVRADGVTDRGTTATVRTDAIEHDPIVTTLAGSENSPPNPHAELAVDWQVADEDGDLAAATVTIENERGATVVRSTHSIGGPGAGGSLGETVKKGAGETYTVTLTVEDAAGNVVTETETIDA